MSLARYLLVKESLFVVAVVLGTQWTIGRDAAAGAPFASRKSDNKKGKDDDKKDKSASKEKIEPNNSPVTTQKEHRKR